MKGKKLSDSAEADFWRGVDSSDFSPDEQSEPFSRMETAIKAIPWPQKKYMDKIADVVLAYRPRRKKKNKAARVKKATAKKTAVK